MIPTKIRESRRVKALKLPKNLDRLYKEGKCRECAVVVTRMDFAKILGKFTKVKIQYESNTTPKGKQNTQVNSKSNARLKSNENGMVLIHRNSNSHQPVKEILSSKKSKRNESSHIPNILKENNRLKKPILKDKNSNYDNQKVSNDSSLKKYGIVFEDPLASNNKNDISTKITLTDLLPQIVESILPSDGWCIDYFPKSDEPKDDKVYDRIAAELEDLMYNEKPILKSDDKTDVTESKIDEFPSIMDILNDNSSESKPTDQNTSIDFKPNIESSDVEAMLLGKSNSTSNPIPPTAMEVDSSDVGNLIEDVVYQLNDVEGTVNVEPEKELPSVAEPQDIENPHSPSILDEALQKGIEEHLPADPLKKGIEEHLPADLLKKGIEEHVPADLLKKGIEEHLPADPLKKGIEEHLPADLLKKGIEEHVPADTLKKGIEEHLPADPLKKGIEEHLPADLLKTGIEEHLPADPLNEGIEEHVPTDPQDNPDTAIQENPARETSNESTNNETIDTNSQVMDIDDGESTGPKDVNKEKSHLAAISGITHVVFKKMKNGTCCKSVTCPKNLKYSVELDGKIVEFLGAPKYISSLGDLQVLLQIVDESALESLSYISALH